MIVRWQRQHRNALSKGREELFIVSNIDVLQRPTRKRRLAKHQSKGLLAKMTAFGAVQDERARIGNRNGV